MNKKPGKKIARALERHALRPLKKYGPASLTDLE